MVSVIMDREVWLLCRLNTDIDFWESSGSRAETKSIAEAGTIALARSLILITSLFMILAPQQG
jgi:hypothetical protein